MHSAIIQFSGAIQIPANSYDEMRGGPKGNPNQDIELHKPFLDFHTFLEQKYPLIHGSPEKNSN